MWTSELSLTALRAAVLAVWGACVAILGARVWAVEPLPRAYMGERGRMRALWLERGTAAEIQERVVRRVGGLLQNGMPRALEDALARSLLLAGEPWGFGALELWSATGCCVVAGSCASAALWHVLGAPASLLLALAMAVAPLASVREHRRARVTAVERSLPIAMDLVALCVRAGSDFPAALRFVVRELSQAHAVCTHELSRVEEAMALGRTRVDALRAFAARLDSPAVGRFVASMVQSEQRGMALADVLTTQAEGLRRLRSVRAEESAAKAGVRMVVPLMLMLGAILTLLLGPLALEGLAW